MIGHLKNRGIRFNYDVSADPMIQSPMARPASNSECAFLREAEAGQGHTFSRFRNLHLHNGRVGRRDFGGPQHGVLRENFAVNFGDQVILAGCVMTPDLPELNAFHGHRFFL